jgi:hypothetical protein
MSGHNLATQEDTRVSLVTGDDNLGGTTGVFHEENQLSSHEYSTWDESFLIGRT